MAPAFSFMHGVEVDTDPENMLEKREPARIFHKEMKSEFSLYDMIVVGILNTENPEGVFNVASLQKVYEVSQYAKTLRWIDEDGRKIGIIEGDMIAPSTLDNIESGGAGVVKFEWLMPQPPKTEEEAKDVYRKAERIPFLEGTVVPMKGKKPQAVCIYLPISSKDLSYRFYDALNKRMPVLWVWAPLRAKWTEALQSAENSDVSNRIIDLATLAAYYSKDLNAFKKQIRLLSDGLSGGKGASGPDAVLSAIDALKSEAAQYDKQTEETIKETGKSDSGAEDYRSLRAYAFQGKIQDRFASDESGSYESLWMNLAAFFFQSRAASVESAAALLETAGNYFEQTRTLLSVAGSGFKDLSSATDSVFSSHSEFPGPDSFHITGLPVAEDTFGVEMFIQMAVSAPMAMLVIFILLLVFFRKFILILSPMIVAMFSVIITMGLLIIFGFPIHIMSSMIPIFIMPIAVLDSIHILSEFFDRYQLTRDRRETISKVMEELFSPMLYTSLTSAAGFISLALTPIPPVQVFGVFVAVGIMTAWILTITFIPSFVMFLKPKTLENFGAAHDADKGEPLDSGFFAGLLKRMGGVTYRRAKVILSLSAVVVVISVYGISKITVNDNPIKWFTASHPIRQADTELNKYLGGTYMSYLVLEAEDKAFDRKAAVDDISEKGQAWVKELQEDLPAVKDVFKTLVELAGAAAEKAKTQAGFLDALSEAAAEKAKTAEGELSFAWDEAGTFVDLQREGLQVFKDPEALKYMERLEKALTDTGIAGKSNSLADIVKTVHRELVSGEEKDYRVPENRRIVAECLIQFQNSHRPNDLWHFVTPDYRKTSLWIQLKSGDNKDMALVVDRIKEFMQANPPPPGIAKEARWFGLTYINVIWQQKMVSGMLQAFLGSFLVVFLLMLILFRSVLWGLLCMIPLLVTIAFMYGIIGFIGKDYDMPVAVLSSLTLGLAVDFAIHFLARSRSLYMEYGDWEDTVPNVFGEPARAITRNIIVIATGFLPLLLAPLVPYRTVGVFLATILLISGLSTLLILPSLVKVLEKKLFAVVKAPVGGACNCAVCFFSSLTLVLILAISFHQYFAVSWGKMTWVGIIVVAVTALICGLLSRREKCAVQ